MERLWREERDRRLCITCVVQRPRNRMAGVTLLPRVLGVLLLQMRTVAQHNFGECGGRLRAVDATGEAVTHE